MLKTTQEKKETVRDFYLPFDFRGNVNNATVRCSKGDGEMDTKGGKETWAKFKANLSFIPNEKKVKLSVNYKVEEKKGDYSILEFDAEQDYPLDGFFKEGELTAKIENNNSNLVKKECTSTIELVGQYNRSYIMTSFLGECHGYMTPQPWDRVQAVKANPIFLKVFPAGRQLEDALSPYVSVLQPWLPVNDLEMKVDDKGNDLKGSGNIGIKGKVRFSVKRVDTITVTTRVDEEQPTPPPSADSEKTTGSEKKLDSIPEKVSSILGHGYDACGCYADTDSVKVPPVIDIDEVNKFQRLAMRPVSKMQKYDNSGESVKAYTESLAKNIHMSASIAAFGGFAKAETERSFNMTQEEHSCDRYASLRSLYKESEYSVSYYSPSQLVGFLHQDFKNALNNLSAMKFIEVYGTHVILGMALGTRFTFSMKYRESSRKHSKAMSFKDSAEVGYKDTGEVQKPEKPEEKSESQKVFDSLNADGVLTAEELKSYAEYIKAAKEGASNPAPSGGGVDINLNASRSQSESWSSSEEDKSTVVKCFCVGGDAYYGELINSSNDATYLPKWVESNKTNCVFCDFVPGQLIPIYEFIPTGYKLTADDVKRAFEEHMTWGVTTQKMEPHITYCEFDTRAEANTENIQSPESSDHDDEISTKSGKDTYWKLQIELLNFDEGKCGFGISLIVKEGGSGGPASILKNHYTEIIPLELGFKQMSINTDYFGGSHFEAQAIWTGEFHGWHDATSFVLNGTAGNVLCHNGNTVEIMIDDKGKDKGHIGVRGRIMIPWIGY